MTEEMYQRQAEMFGVLSHPIRLRILDVLTQGEACVCHLCAALGQRQAYISQHLAKLKDAGLITDDKQGLYVYYSLADEDISVLLRDARQWMARLTGDEAFREVAAPKPGEFECPCPHCQASSSTD
jgi:ArsR family transcriptional regulator